VHTDYAGDDPTATTKAWSPPRRSATRKNMDTRAWSPPHSTASPPQMDASSNADWNDQFIRSSGWLEQDAAEVQRAAQALMEKQLTEARAGYKRNMLQMRDEFRSQIKILRAQYDKAAARAANAVVVAKTTSEALEVAQREAFEAFGSLRATLRERDHSKAECINLRKQNKELRAVLSEQDALETRAGLLIKLSEQGEQHKTEMASMQTERRQLLQRNKSLGDELETATRQSALESGVTVLNAELTSTKEMFQKKVVSLSLERDEAVTKAQDKVVVLVRQPDEAISSADAATSRAAAVEATVAVLRAESEAACATNSRALAAARDSSSSVQRELVTCRAAASASSSEQSTLLRAAQGKAAAAEQQATSLRVELDAYRAAHSSLRVELDAYRAAHSSSDEDVVAFKSAKDDALAAAADAAARATAAEQQATSLQQSELDGFRAASAVMNPFVRGSSARTRPTRTSSLDEDMAALKSEKDDALSAAADAGARATAAEQQVTSLQTELDARRADPAVNPFVRGSSARTRPTRTSSLDEDVAALKSEKDVALSAAADADARAVAAEHQAASLQAELDAFRRTQTQNTADEPLQSLSSPVFDGEVSMALALTTSAPNEEVAKLRAAKEDADARAAAAEQALARCDESSVDLPDSAMMAKQLDHAELCAAKEDADARAAAAEQTLARRNQIMDLPDSAMMAKQLAQARAAEKDTAVIISTLQHEMDDLNARNVSVEKEDALAAAVTACASVAEQMSVSYRQTFEEKKVLLAASETAIARAEKAEEAAALLRSALEDATHGPPPLGTAASSHSLISLSTSGADSEPHAQQHDRDDDDDDDDDGDATSSDTLFLPLASTRDRNVVLIEPAADELPRVAEAPAPSISHHSALSEIEDATHGPPPLGIAASSHSLVSLSTSGADSEFRAKQHDRDDDDEDDDDGDATSSDTIFLPPALTRDRDVMLIEPAADELPRVAEAPAPSILHHSALSEIDQKGFEASTLPFLNQEALEHAPNQLSNDEIDSSVGSFSSCKEAPPPPGNGAEYDSDRDSADTSVCASVGVDASKSNDTADYLRAAQRERARALIERASSSPTATPATENRVE